MSGTPSSTKSALLVLSIEGQFPELLKLAIDLKKKGESVEFYFNLGYPHEQRLLKEIGARGLSWSWYDEFHARIVREQPVQEDFEHPSQKPSLPTPRKVHPMEKLLSVYKPTRKILHLAQDWRSLIKNFIKAKIARPLHQVWSRELRGFLLRRRLRRRFQVELNYLKELQPQAIFFGEDSCDYFNPITISAAKRFGCATFVLPYSLANHREFAEDAFTQKRFVDSGPAYRAIAKNHPHWTLQYRGRHLVKSEPYLIETYQKLKLSPPNPWVMNSGFANAILVESPFMNDYYLKAGIPAEQMKITGFPSLDALAESWRSRDTLRAELCRKHGFDINRPIALTSFPNNQWPRPALGFETYDQFVAAYMNEIKALESSGYQILHRFHPRVSEKFVRHILDQYDLQHSNEDTTHLIPLADLYIATVSATIRWALACGIPVINYDAYGYNYDDFTDFPEVRHAYSREDFRRVIAEINHRPRKTGPWLENPYFGDLKSSSCARIHQLMLKSSTVTVEEKTLLPREI